MKTNKLEEHTPTPWFIASDNRGILVGGKRLGMMVKKENSAFIVRAVNAYEKDQEIKKELLTALKEMRTRYARLEGIYAEKVGITYDCPNGTIKLADQAIAKAEGK